MANSLKIGSTSTSAIYAGSSAVSKLYMGTSQVWPIVSSGTGRPVQTASYGPNGTHWPSQLRFPTESFGSDTTVDCTWAAINSAVAGLSASDVSGHAIIRVRDGSLAGSGAGSTSTSPVDGMGNSAWTRQVLIVPLSGYGGVTITSSTAFANVNNVAFAGFKYVNDANFAIRDSTNLTMLWSKVNTWSITGGGSNISLYEIASGYSRPYLLGSSDYDTNAIRPAGTDTIVGVNRIGCHAGPTRKQVGSGYHMEGLQFERANGATQRYGQLYIEDCFDVAASNAVYLFAGGADDIEIRHTWGVGGKLSYVMDPPTGQDYDADDVEDGPNCFSGSAANVRIYDSSFIGSYGSLDYSVASNVRRNSDVSTTGQNPTTGSWTIDTTMNDMTLSDFLAISPKPTDARCTSIWAGKW